MVSTVLYIARPRNHLHLNDPRDGKGVLITSGPRTTMRVHVHLLYLLKNYSKSFFPYALIFVPSLLLYGRGEGPRKGGESWNDVVVVHLSARDTQVG